MAKAIGDIQEQLMVVEARMDSQSCRLAAVEDAASVKVVLDVVAMLRAGALKSVGSDTVCRHHIALVEDGFFEEGPELVCDVSRHEKTEAAVDV